MVLRPEHHSTAVLIDTRRWLEKAVIGLNLCPFAKAVYVKNQVHLALGWWTHAADVLEQLESELLALQALPAAERDTTVLVLPNFMPDFLDFNDFLCPAERVLKQCKLQGEIQIAHFHPQFEFAGENPHGMSHYTNRAPYPMLHLIREASIEKALASFPDPDSIYERNIQTLEKMGPEGWAALGVGRHV
ncbi:DUF1415 domain-containing protein [Curvibacter sp. CHRR-16]|uniref:DUF1415 domain-containing protein n=1 Tax=Curvibacter sp. CHRR-16 TaxID=2835872 RepID=UPI001BDA779B|nr:DUF1415 domain-containing protein [Curvibacter sp. CHRR-16]MBT0569450.1 DUF1415 domain-containing protein [Curvibacter sp. CHRR-16]